MAEGGEFETMEAAFRDTARGRWFLDEWARRVRQGETDTLLQALGHIERAMVALDERRTDGEAAPLPLARTVPPDIDATLPILEATERIQEIAWELREQGVASEVCDRLDAAASDIYAACAGHPPVGAGGTKPQAPPVAAAEPLPNQDPADEEVAEPGDYRPAPAGLAIGDLTRTLRRDDSDPKGTNEKRRVLT